jgi:hypothetical protein
MDSVGVAPTGLASAVAAAPRVVRITRLVSLPGRGPDLVDRCRRIADRERARHPGAYRVVQTRQARDGNRIEVVSITEWIDLDLMQTVIPPGPHTEPPFWSEYADCVESWEVEVSEVTWTTEDGHLP